MMHSGAGPEERKLRNRLIYKITGRWPRSVVDERLRQSDLLTTYASCARLASLLKEEQR